MAKTLHRLTAKQIGAAAPGVTLNDGGGLFFRATTKGSGRWTFKFTSNDPDYLAAQTAKGSKLRQREMGLGAWPATTLAIARENATAARELVARGLDPIEEERRAEIAGRVLAEETARLEASKAMTFGRYAEEHFLPSVLHRFSNAAHIQQWQATFRRHAAALRDKPLADITREDVLAVLRPIWMTKNVTASRSRERLKRLFAHAIQNGHFHRDNPASWEQFNATLPPPRKLTRGHHPSLPHQRVAEFVVALRDKQKESMAALMLEWILLSACRTGDARFANWSEIDLDENVWSIPAERMKMRRAHVVPITGRMAEILAEAAKWRQGPPKIEDPIFFGPKGKPLSEMAALMLLRRMEPSSKYTTHGLRSTFKDWALTCTDYPDELSEEQLAHQLGAVQQAYRRTPAVERRRTMMEDWATYCAGAPLTAAGENILPLRKNGGQA